MAVNREKRKEVAAGLASLMRGEIGLAEINALRDRLFPDGWPGDDPLAQLALDRLDKHWRCVAKSAPLQATPLEWEKLRRWIALLHTDIDWEQSGYWHGLYPESKYDWIGCLVLPLTIAAMVAAFQLYDGRPFDMWVSIGALLAPAVVIYLLWWLKAQERADPKPFASFDHASECIHLADRYTLPQYDSRVHGLHVGTRLRRHGLPYGANMFMVVVLTVTIWPAVVVFLWLRRREAKRVLPAKPDSISHQS